MGNFIEVNNDGVKTYTLFTKNTMKEVIALQRLMPMYSFAPFDKYKSTEVFLDSSNNLLSSAGILLSKATEKNKAWFKVERERYKANKSSIQRAEKVFIHNIGVRDSALDHLFFLTDGIKSMFSTQFYIDLDNVLKLVVPKIELKIKKTVFKVFSGKGFKAEIIFEDVDIKNYESRRAANLQFMTVKQTSSSISKDEFEDFTSKLEKYCKEVIPTEDTKYEIAKRMTK